MIDAQQMWTAMISHAWQPGDATAFGRDMYFARPWGNASGATKSALMTMAAKVGVAALPIYDTLIRQRWSVGNLKDIGTLVNRKVGYAALPPKARAFIDKIASEVPVSEVPEAPSSEAARRQIAVAQIAHVAKKHRHGRASKAELIHAAGIAQGAGLAGTSRDLLAAASRMPGTSAGATRQAPMVLDGPDPSGAAMPILILAFGFMGAHLAGRAIRSRRRA